MKTKVLLSLLIGLSSLGSFATMGAAGPVRAGAARVNITPSKGDLPPNFLGIHDSIYSRAIVIDNGVSGAALISVDVGFISDPAWNRITQQVEQQLGIPARNVLLTVTHTHSVPFRMGGEKFEQQIFASVKKAKDLLQPAKIGYGTGVSYINVNRNIIDPVTRRWWEGPNYEGPSDKTVAVITFESIDGNPIAVYYNYAMHAVITGQLDMISGDVPGAASRYIEESFDNKVVALWSTGAEGDQNPVYYQQTYDLREIRIKDYAERGEDISNAMPPGGTGLDRSDPEVARLMEEQQEIAHAMGVMLGEEVKHVIRGIQRKDAQASIAASQKLIYFPGRRRTDTGRAGFAGSYEDGDSVQARIGVLLVNDIAITSINGEVFSPIAQQLKKESPYARTMMATATNGMATTGYIPNDAAFGQYTFEVLSSRLQPGYAERTIIDGLLDLMEEVKQDP
jgi:neutral ceramidase